MGLISSIGFNLPVHQAFPPTKQGQQRLYDPMLMLANAGNPQGPQRGPREGVSGRAE